MKISIETGHGGTDYGAVRGAVAEKDIALTVAAELKRILERHGQTVLISRETDINDRAAEFYAKASAFKPDVAVSVHVNAFDGTAKGFEVYYRNTNLAKPYEEKSKRLCSAIEEEVLKLGGTSRGVKTADFIMLNLPCAGAYCELGFLDNPAEYTRFDTPEKQKKYAEAYAKGILKFADIKFTEENNADIVQKRENTSNVTGKILYRVIAGSFSEKTNAANHREQLKNAGVDTFIEAVQIK
jgi:N-acetylmuramoyl-L-alanine amidase